MGRLTRAEMQERTRVRVLAAARDEFAERGFRHAKVDAIAERAELTRGAVYSNFPGKRALYFAVLAEDAERTPAPPDPQPGRTPGEALAALARAEVARLPLATGEPRRLDADLVPEILAADRIRRAYGQLLKLQAVVLGLALERLPTAPGGRLVRVAEVALTLLHGASQMAEAAPDFLDPFNVVRVSEHLAGVDLGDLAPRPIVPAATPADDPWTPPPARDALRDRPARLGGDGVVAILGLHRASTAELAVRAAPDLPVTAVLVSGDPGGLGPLARLMLAELRTHLRHAVPAPAWPDLQVVCDEGGAVAAAACVCEVGDATEAAVRVEAGRVVARAEGLGAALAAASAGEAQRRTGLKVSKNSPSGERHEAADPAQSRSRTTRDGQPNTTPRR